MKNFIIIYKSILFRCVTIHNVITKKPHFGSMAFLCGLSPPFHNLSTSYENFIFNGHFDFEALKYH